MKSSTFWKSKLSVFVPFKYPDYIEKDIREISQYLERLNTNSYPNSGIELADNKINTFHKITDPYKPSSCEPDGYSDLMDV